MFHVVFSLTSRFLYLRNVLQGFAHGILALRSLGTISHLIPALSPPPPVPLLGAPAPFVERLEEIVSPFPSGDLIVIERQFPVFASASPFPIYQSSLIAVTPSQFPKFLPIFVILAVISGFVVILPEIAYFFMNIAKIPSAFAHASRTIVKPFKSKPTISCLPDCLPSQFSSCKLSISLISLLFLWTGPPAIATFSTFVWFMTILFSYEHVSNTVVVILQWCGLLTVQDTRTPPLLDAIYEQITRGAVGYSDLVRCNDLSDEHGKDQVITDYSLGYSHLAAQLSAHELDLQHAQMRREKQERDVAGHHSYVDSEFVTSQDNLYRHLESSSARDQKLHADLLASEQERERLKVLVSTLEASCRDRQGWEEIAADAKASCAEAEMTASNLRADLAAAADRVRNVQEQLDHQIELVSNKDDIIQSITKESRLTLTRLRLSKDMIKRSDAKVLDERYRRLCKTKELLDEKSMMQDRHEAEIRLLTQEAQDAHEKLDALRDTVLQLRRDRQLPLDRDYPLRYQPPTTCPYDTGQPPRPPESALDNGTRPVNSTINPDSSFHSTKRLPHSHSRDQEDSSTRLAARLLEIPGFCDLESEVAKEQRAALEELIKRMREGEPDSPEDVKPDKRDEKRLQEELIATKEKLRVAEEEVRDLRRELGQSRESIREVETHVRALENELDVCRAALRDVQDAQHASEVKFVEASRLQRLHQAESESLMARAEASQFKSSQATLLCTALQERVTELEAKVKKLKSARKDQRHTNSRSGRPTNTCTGAEAIAHDGGIRDVDSIYMTVSPSLPCLLDLSLPPSSSQSSISSLYSSQVPPTCTDSHSPCPADIDLDVITSGANSSLKSLDLSRLLSPSLSESFSLPPFVLPRGFLSERNGLGSVDWPPIGPSLLSEDGNVRQDDNIGVTAEEMANNSTLLSQRSLLSPIGELDEERHTSLDRPVVPDNDPEYWDLFRRDPTPDAPSPHLSALQVDIPMTPQRDQVTLSSSRIFDLPLPVFPRITLPPFSLPPSDIHKMLGRHLASSDCSATETGSAAPDPPLAKNGEFHSTASSFPRADEVLQGRSCRTQDDYRAVPAHHQRSNRAGPAGVTSSWISSNPSSPVVHVHPLPGASSTPPSILPVDTQSKGRTMQPDSLPLSIPAHLEACGKPTAVLGSRNKGIDSVAGTLSSRTALGSRTSADQGTSMRAPRRPRDPAPRSSNVISTRSDTTSLSSGLPLPQISNLPDVSLGRKDAKTQAVKRVPEWTQRPLPSRLVPELLDQASSIQLDGTSLVEDDRPGASGKARKGHRHIDYRVSSRPRNTSNPDCCLPGDSQAVSTLGNVDLEWPDPDFKDFVFSIPPDCPTSTPVASKKRASRKSSATGGKAALAGVGLSLGTTRAIKATRH